MEKVFAATRSKPAQSNAELGRTTRRLKAFHHGLSIDVACGSEIPLNSPFHLHRHGLPPSPIFMGTAFILVSNLLFTLSLASFRLVPPLALSRSPTHRPNFASDPTLQPGIRIW